MMQNKSVRNLISPWLGGGGEGYKCFIVPYSDSFHYWHPAFVVSMPPCQFHLPNQVKMICKKFAYCSHKVLGMYSYN